MVVVVACLPVVHSMATVGGVNQHWNRLLCGSLIASGRVFFFGVIVARLAALGQRYRSLLNEICLWRVGCLIASLGVFYLVTTHHIDEQFPIKRFWIVHALHITYESLFYIVMCGWDSADYGLKQSISDRSVLTERKNYTIDSHYPKWTGLR